MPIPSPGDRGSCPVTKRLRRPGSAAVEFAIIAPILTTLMLGMVEVTRVIQVKNYLSDAARSGCRLAIQSGSSTQSVKSNINTILTNNGISASYATITVRINGHVADAATAVQDDKVSVQISLPISQVNWVTPIFFSDASVESEILVMMHQ
jgi:Flp pilus assembly protein TadG